MKLSPLDRAYLEALLTDIISCHGDAPSAVYVGSEAGTALEMRCADGDVTAVRVFGLLARMRLTHEAAKLLREQGTIRIGWDGGAVTLPKRLAVRLSESSARQYPLWEEVTWDQLAKIRDDLVKRNEKLTANVFALGGILALRACYPDAARPLDAMVAAGIDPENIQLAL